MPKKTKPNGFLLFMMDYRKREERKGRSFRGGIQEVQNDPQCNQEWQSMSVDKKAEYNRRAKDCKKGGAGKKTGTGESMDAVEREKMRKVEFAQNMNDEIESIVAMAMEFGNLPLIKFNFIHSNWFHTRSLENNEFDYIPAEFAVSEFSLKDGVTKIYHQILKTEIRCGYTREAMETSQETHQLPWNLQCGEDRFEVMAENLKEFLKPGMDGNKYPALYTSRQISPAVKALIKRLTHSLNVPNETFIVYELEVLFKYLRNAAMQKAGVVDSFHTVMAEYELIKDAFSFTPGLDCDFHKNLDGTSQFCSMSIVKRWAFTICDYCCENLGVEMLHGVHLPLKIHSDQSNMSDTMSVLSEKINVMQIQDTIGIKSMTGVSKEYRTRVSERTDAEEQKRRNDKRTVTVVKYGDLANSPPAEPEPEPAPVTVPPPKEYQIPLRRPHSISHAHIAGKQKEDEHTYNESEFPSLGVSVGRGNGARRKDNEPRPGAGRGRGIALS
ncbi:protein maelstrom homolog [Belonocnema kinseyi]|uniref:protein maelstrom homolog n=1 Tax=Belonocnema kinseyi TaxID=2817044 RepID=UPI00143D7727|nr:protein maelstrom homolog [Belonocnema kinseyi]